MWCRTSSANFANPSLDSFVLLPVFSSTAYSPRLRQIVPALPSLHGCTFPSSTHPVNINQTQMSVQGNSSLIEEEFDELMESVDLLLLYYCCVKDVYHCVNCEALLAPGLGDIYITLTTSWVISVSSLAVVDCTRITMLWLYFDTPTQ